MSNTLCNTLVASNVDFPGRGTLHTHKRSTLDYVLVRNRYKSSVRDVVVRSAPFDTDHKFLEADFKIKWKAPLGPLPHEKPDVRVLRGPLRSAEFAEMAPALPHVKLLMEETPKPSSSWLAPDEGPERMLWFVLFKRCVQVDIIIFYREVL